MVSIQGQGFLYACPLPGRQDTLSTAAKITQVGWGSHADQPWSGVGAERPGHGRVSWSGFYRSHGIVVDPVAELCQDVRAVAERAAFDRAVDAGVELVPDHGVGGEDAGVEFHAPAVGVTQDKVGRDAAALPYGHRPYVRCACAWDCAGTTAPLPISGNLAGR